MVRSATSHVVQPVATIAAPQIPPRNWSYFIPSRAGALSTTSLLFKHYFQSVYIRDSVSEVERRHDGPFYEERMKETTKLISRCV